MPLLERNILIILCALVDRELVLFRVVVRLDGLNFIVPTLRYPDASAAIARIRHTLHGLFACFPFRQCCSNDTHNVFGCPFLHGK